MRAARIEFEDSDGETSESFMRYQFELVALDNGELYMLDLIANDKSIVMYKSAKILYANYYNRIAAALELS